MEDIVGSSGVVNKGGQYPKKLWIPHNDTQFKYRDEDLNVVPFSDVRVYCNTGYSDTLFGDGYHVRGLNRRLFVQVISRYYQSAGQSIPTPILMPYDKITNEVLKERKIQFLTKAVYVSFSGVGPIRQGDKVYCFHEHRVFRNIEAFDYDPKTDCWLGTGILGDIFGEADSSRDDTVR